MGQENPDRAEEIETSEEQTLAADQMEGSLAEKGLGILVDTKLTMSQQSALGTKALNGFLVCIRQSVASSCEEGDLSSLLSTGYGYTSGVLAPAQYRRSIDVRERVQGRATKMALERLLYEERLRDLRLFSLDKRRFWGFLSMYMSI